MVKLVLTPSCEARLLAILSPSPSLPLLPPELEAELSLFLGVHAAGTRSTRDGDGPAQGGAVEGGAQKERRPWVEHSLVAKTAKALRGKETALRERGLDPSTYRLSDLLGGTEVYAPPKVVKPRSAELEALLASIQLEHDHAMYASMLSSSLAPRSFISLAAGSAPAHSSLLPSLPRHANARLSAENEEEAWRQAKKHLAAVTNVLFSGFGVAFAVWYALGSAGWTIEARVGMAMLSGFVVVGAEAFLYSRFLGKGDEEGGTKRRRQEEMEEKARKEEREKILRSLRDKVE